MALVAETWPAPLRARACSYVALGWQAGVLVAALVTPALLPIIGWRGMFLVGLIPGLVAFAVRLYVGEPKIFLNTKNAATKDAGGTAREGRRDRQNHRHVRACASRTRLLRLDDLDAELSVRQIRLALTQSVPWTAVTVLGMAFGIRSWPLPTRSAAGRCR
jgi:MFS family permease